MISHLVSFVKLFFQVFQTFLSRHSQVFSVLSSRRPRRRLAYYTRGEPPCQPPFLSFFKLFSEATVHSLGDGSLPWPQGPAAKRLVILPDCFSFVNTFFRDFLIFSTHSQNTPFCPYLSFICPRTADTPQISPLQIDFCCVNLLLPYYNIHRRRANAHQNPRLPARPRCAGG